MKRASWILFQFSLLAFSCTTVPKKDSIPDEKSSYLQRFEIQEYSTKEEYGNLVKDELVYHYVETYTQDGYLEKSITLFGYDFELDSHLYFYDTLPYTHSVNNNHVDYYIDGELTEIEVKKGNTIFVYDVEDPEIPMIVRKFDSVGNIISELVTDGDTIFSREFETITKEAKGHVTQAYSHWSKCAFTETFNFGQPDLNSLVKSDSAIYLANFKYEMKELN